eukprot:6517067-Prorocentrum_lima.AAC.1
MPARLVQAAGATKKSLQRPSRAAFDGITSELYRQGVDTRKAGYRITTRQPARWAEPGFQMIMEATGTQESSSKKKQVL